MFRFVILLAVVFISLGFLGLAPHASYEKSDCELFSGLGLIQANPAGVLDKRLEVVSLRICPPIDGLAEITRKKIELKHNLLRLLSAKSEEQLKDPLRIEILQQEIKELVNGEILKKGKAVEVFITRFELF